MGRCHAEAIRVHGFELGPRRAASGAVGGLEEIELAGRVSFELKGYSHGGNPIPAVARIGNLIMTGGISGSDLTTAKMPDSIEAQCANMFDLAAKILEAPHAHLADVINVTSSLNPSPTPSPLSSQ